MANYARVVVESDLLQLDREFDFLVPENLSQSVRVGQRVRFQLGRTKKLASGFIASLPLESAFATSELVEIVDLEPVVKEEIFKLARQVANRQAVALGEILQHAVVEHMPRITKTIPESNQEVLVEVPEIPGITSLAKRSAVLTSARSLTHEGMRYPDWCWLFLLAAVESIQAGKSAILIVPERDQISQLAALFSSMGLKGFISNWLPGAKKSDRFTNFHRALSQESSIVIGSRSAIYAPVRNLGVIALFDDGDDSLREQGSPHTHAREISLMRATDDVKLLFAANYRSLEIQRLVEIGYLTDLDIKLPPARISYSPPSQRLDAASFKLMRDALEDGPVLVLIPRKGNSATVYCAGCDQRLICNNCKGPIWENEKGEYRCRVCQGISHSCAACGSNKLRRGRTGSTRTAAEFGKAFPGITISEFTSDTMPTAIKKSKHLVLATPGSAPRVQNGYAALLILDSDVWLAMPQLRSEQRAIRDWMEAIELLSDTGRAHIAGVDQDLGQALSLGQHRALATNAFREVNSLSLPPAARIATLEGTQDTISQALELATKAGATVLRSNLSESASALIRFSYNQGAEVSASLKALALKTNARLVGANKRRGLKIVMDDPGAL
jgi:primosomal protein N' (replication factor Y)